MINDWIVLFIVGGAIFVVWLLRPKEQHISSEELEKNKLRKEKENEKEEE